MQYYLTTFNTRGTHWTLWSYKRSARMGDGGIVRTSVAPDVLSNSYEELSTACARYATRPEHINTGLVALITECNTALRTNTLATRVTS